MVGYSSIKIVDMDNNFDLLCRKIWRKKDNQTSPNTYVQGQDLEECIRTCEREWKRLGYNDERTWPHLFPSMLFDLPNKLYKMEEARGETF